MLLTDFQSIRPKFESTQQSTLNWLVEAHVKAEGNEALRPLVQKTLSRVGCKPDHIEKRGHVLPDFLHLDWEKMEVYRLHETPSGKSLNARTQIFDREVDEVFASYYPIDATAPDDLIHVSCTGYISPSGAQKIVSKRCWGDLTTVTHAYHMGCYGSIPAIRMGMGFLKIAQEKKRADIVHTEICSLHSNPSLHGADQLVTQSLFADGFMKYSIVKKSAKDHLKILSIREEIIPHSTDLMSWHVADWGFQMSLAKEVPSFLIQYLPKYLQRLCNNSFENVLFAIHPGGPKILKHVQKLLHLSDHQLHFSCEVLKNFGNMSSATLPHIWQKILTDPSIKNGTKVISLAFGPGLSVAGLLMEKICGI